MTLLKVCDVGPSKSPPEPNTPPFHPTLGSCKYLSFWKKENKFTFHQVALRETFELLDNPECDKLGRQSWVVITIVVTELLICIKFGWATITKPLPRHIALWWVLGAALLLVYTVVKFYLLKPNHVPQPEKEHIRVGSPLGSSTGMQRCL